MTSLARTALLATVTTAAVLLSGCASSNSQNVSYSAIAGNPSPELIGLADRPIDRHAHMMVANHHNKQMLSDDIMRFFYLDHPSRLTPYPLMHLSGGRR